MTEGEVVLGSEGKEGLKGQVLDTRFYISAPTVAETQMLFKSKRGKCVVGCQICESPIRCETCEIGYSLVNGMCQDSICADYYVIGNKTLNVHEHQVHLVSAPQLYTTATITYVTRTGTPRWNVDWGAIAIREETEARDRVTVLRTRPMHQSHFQLGTNLSVSATGPGTYGIYMSFAWPKVDLAYEVELEHSIAPVQSHYGHILKDTAIVHLVGNSYELVNSALIDPNSIVSSRLSAQVRERLFTVRLTRRSTLRVALTSCDERLSLRVMSSSDPGVTADYFLLNETIVGEIRDAIGLYRFTVTGSERKPYNNTFQVTVTSSTSNTQIPIYENLWLTPTSDSSDIHIAWRPMIWDDGSEITAPVSYLLQIAHRPVGQANMCNLETIRVDHRDITLDRATIEGNVNIFAVLPTDLGTVTVPYATTQIEYRQGFSPLFLMLVIIVLFVPPTALIVVGYLRCSQNLEKASAIDERYHLLAGSF